MEDGHSGSNGSKKFLKKFSNGFAHWFGSDHESEQVEEEIRQMVTEGHERGIFEEDEAKMINNIFEFSDKDVSDIMTHRKHVRGVDSELTAGEAAKIIIEDIYSRYPVYEEDVDNIIGTIHVKELMRALVEHEEHLSLKQLMRAPYFVPETQSIDNLFKQMQQKKEHMAIVIDEYGQTSGIVTMEDILEEIVGNIFDEYDLEEVNIIKKDAVTYLMKGTAPLDEVQEALGIEFEEDEFDTLNGLLIAHFEHIPSEEEKVSAVISGYRFIVLSVKNNMINDVKVVKLGQKSGLESH